MARTHRINMVLSCSRKPAKTRLTSCVWPGLAETPCLLRRRVRAEGSARSPEGVAGGTEGSAGGAQGITGGPEDIARGAERVAERPESDLFPGVVVQLVNNDLRSPLQGLVSDARRLVSRPGVLALLSHIPEEPGPELGSQRIVLPAVRRCSWLRCVWKSLPTRETWPASFGPLARLLHHSNAEQRRLNTRSPCEAGNDPCGASWREVQDSSQLPCLYQPLLEGDLGRPN
jgi:hypothetical protein